MSHLILTPIDRIGQRTIQEARFAKQLFALLYFSVKQFWKLLLDQIFHRQKGIRDITRVVVMQIYFTGVQSLGIISLLGFLIGSVVVLQSITQMAKFGGSNQIGELVVVTILRDVGPLLTTLIIIARSGTAIAAEIATMKVNHEIDALVAMGISPLEYIVIPRVMGGIASVFALNVWFCAVGIVGGFLLSALILNLSSEFYFEKIFQAITAADFVAFTLKNVLCGGAIFLIACMQGLSAQVATYEVPIVTIGSVVKSVTFALVFHAIATGAFYLFTSSTLLGFLLGE